MSRATAPPVRVARGASFGAWSTDGRQIAVQQMRGWRTSVGVVRPGADDVRTLVTDADHAWPNDWSPDDRYIVYAALRAGRWAIEAVEVATGRVSRLTPPGAATEYVRWPVWSPRGDRIVYERGLLDGQRVGGGLCPKRRELQKCGISGFHRAAIVQALVERAVA